MNTYEKLTPMFSRSGSSHCLATLEEIKKKKKPQNI